MMQFCKCSRLDLVFPSHHTLSIEMPLLQQLFYTCCFIKMYFRSYHSVHVSPIYFALLCKTRDPPFASDHHCILSVSSFRLVFFISFLPRTSTQLNFFLESLYFAIANIFMHASQLTLLSSSFFLV